MAFTHKSHPDQSTDETLLVRLTDPHDLEAWYEFVAIYRPLLERVGRRFQMQAADRENLCQDVFQKVARQIETFCEDSEHGHFRRWLTCVARNTAVDVLRRVRPDTATGGTTIQQSLQQIPHQPEASREIVQSELEREAFCWAAKQVQPEFAATTWTAFWATMVDGRGCPEMSEELGMSVGAIYTARSRVMRRLKEVVANSLWQASEDETG